MAAQKKGGGGKLSRSEVVTVRLDPRLRFGVELAARKHRRTTSSFIEWALEDALSRVGIRESDDFIEVVTADEVLDAVWDVDEPDRFAKLALQFPELLTHEEQILWKLIRENGLLWKGFYEGPYGWVWDVKEETLDFELLREHWPLFVAVADGDKERSTLPKWRQKQQSDPPLMGVDDDSFVEGR